MTKPQVILAAGARGTGKSAWMVRQCAADRRLFVWDFKGDPRLRGVGERFTMLGPALAAMQAPTFRVHYVVNQDADVALQFELVCRAAFKVGRMRLCVMELPEVTSVRKPPPTWRKLVNVGREYEDAGRVQWVSLITETQRPAEIDMSLRGNVDVWHVGRLGNVRDCEMFSRMWGVPVQELSTMPDLHWIEHRQDRPGVTRGVLTFPGGAVTKNKSRNR
jgi:hypothetical protein